MALGLGLAMTAPAFATDYDGVTNITTTVTIGGDMRLAPTGGSSSTFNITSTGSFTAQDGGRIGEDGDYAELNVAFGGNLHMDGEVTGNQGKVTDQTIRLNIFGTAFIEQLKFSEENTDDTLVVVGDGTNVATLTVIEGFFAKNGFASMTVNNNSSFILDTDFGSSVGTFGIDTGGNASGGYIDLVGTGTIKVLTAAGSSNGFGAAIAGTITGNGGTTAVTSEVDGDYLVYSTSAIPEPSSMSLLALGGLALLRRRRRA